MSKYDFNFLDTSDSSSTGLILKKIGNGSTVLEFGCAAGRMTKYMKEVKHCRVYIVEFEQDAYEKAMQFAENGVCDDILGLTWLEKFKDISFEAIIFADVLEHLTVPERALSKAAKLLKPGGIILVSIPNVTHNDVLLKAFHDEFSYTKLGLLDDTHVRFWGYHNLPDFAQRCGLYIDRIEASYCETGGTEQYAGSALQEDQLLLNQLQARRFGEVYQFIITFRREPARMVIDIKEPTIKSHIYLDCGEGFQESNVIEFESAYLSPGSCRAACTIQISNDVRALRFDPVEAQSCIVKRLSIRNNGREVKLSYFDSIPLTEGFLLPGTDPMVFTDSSLQSGRIELEAEFILPGAEYLSEIQSRCVQQLEDLKKLEVQFQETALNFRTEVEQDRNENADLRGKLNRKTEENLELSERLAKTESDAVIVQKYLAEKELESAGLRQSLAKSKSETADLRRNLAEKKIAMEDLETKLAKQMLVLQELNQKLERQGLELLDLNEKIKQQATEIRMHQEAIECYEAMPAVRAEQFVRKILHKGENR